MSSKWKVSKTSTVLETPYFSVVKDDCVDFDDKPREHYRITRPHSGFVMVVPVKVDPVSRQVRYVMVEQYRHGCGAVCLEFPAGARNLGEGSREAAIRELKEETGYEAKDLKFLYQTHLSPVNSSDVQGVYVAVVEGEPGEPKREPSEVGAGMKVVELSAEELHSKIRNNDITSTCTLASLCAVLLQSKKAIKYLTMEE